MTKERFDIHQHVTDKIVSAIEHGAGDFDRSHNLRHRLLRIRRPSLRRCSLPSCDMLKLW